MSKSSDHSPPWMRVESFLSLVGMLFPMISGWLEGVPFTVSVFIGLATAYVLLRLWTNYGAAIVRYLPPSWRPRLPGEDRDQEGGKATPDTFSMALASGSVERRWKIEEYNDEKWYCVRVSIHNLMPRTVKNLSVLGQARTWKMLFLPTYEESKIIGLPSGEKNDTLHPKSGYDLLLLSQNKENKQVLFGDAKSGSPIELPHGTHFITIVIQCEDSEPTYKNLVVVTTEEGPYPYVVEYDKRRWGHPNNAPSPFLGLPDPDL